MVVQKITAKLKLANQKKIEILFLVTGFVLNHIKLGCPIPSSPPFPSRFNPPSREPSWLSRPYLWTPRTHKNGSSPLGKLKMQTMSRRLPGGADGDTKFLLFPTMICSPVLGTANRTSSQPKPSGTSTECRFGPRMVKRNPPSERL